MKKPVRKRKGYAEGGRVAGGFADFVDTTGDQLAERWNRSSKSPETQTRYTAARDAMISAKSNEKGQGASRFMENFGITPESRADYPGFKKGGPVKKVAKKVVRKR